MTPLAISRRIGAPLDVVTEALEYLSQPDPASRSKKCEGRRIVLLDPERNWGWKVVNRDMYKRLRDQAERREYHREYRRKRNPAQPGATRRNQPQPQAVGSRNKAVGIDSTPLVNGKAVDREWEAAFHEHFWPAAPRKVAKEAALRAWRKLGRGMPLSEREDLLGRIMTRFEDRIRSEWAGRERDKIPHPATFLNGESFAPEEFGA